MRRATLSVLMGTATLAASKAAALVLLARALGPELQGAFSLVVALLALASEILSVGIEYSLPVGISGKRESLHETVPVMLWILGVGAIGSVPLIITWLAFGPLALIGPTSSTAATIGLFTVILFATGIYRGVRAHFVGLNDYTSVGLVDGITGALWLPLAWVTVTISYQAILLGWAMAFLFPSLVGLANVLRRTQHPLAWNGFLMRRTLSFGVKTLPGTVARSLNRRGLLYLAAIVLSPTQVGIYAVILAVADAFLYLPTALSHLALGRSASGLWRSSDSGTMTRWLLVTGAIASLLAWQWGGPVLATTFGPAYAEGSTALAVLFAASTLHSIGLVRLHVLVGEGNPWAASVAQVTTLSATVVFGTMLVPSLGLLGAALTSVAAYATFLFTLHSRLVGPRSRS